MLLKVGDAGLKVCLILLYILVDKDHLCPLNFIQSKSKTSITRGVHLKFNCITVKYNRTQYGNYYFDH